MSETKIIEIDKNNIDLQKMQCCSDCIKNGGTVIFPTETVYGLGANAKDEDAVAKIFAAKGRPQDNPLIVHLSDVSQLEQVAVDVSDRAKRLFMAFAPGPLTVVLKRGPSIPASVSAGLDTVAVRIPSHPVARALIELSGLPIAAPSANISGKPSPTAARHVTKEMDGRVDYIIDSDDCEVGVESTVVSLVQEPPILLRPGKITLRQLESVLGTVNLSTAIFAKFDGTAAAPGMKYRHYAPRAKMVLVRGYDTQVREYIHSKISHSNLKCGVLCFDGEQEYFKQATAVKSYGNHSQPETLAHGVFDALRYFDETDVEIIYARVSDGSGIEMAVYNRLLKAAAFNVIEV